MNTSGKTVVGVVFGGRSAEHEVSVITGHQIMDALKVAGYHVLPVYVTKEGLWFAGSGLHNLELFSSPSIDLKSVAGVEQTSLSPDRSVRHLTVSTNKRWSFFGKPEPLRADVWFPAIHGTLGEDGTIQGLFEMADVAYVGSGVLASAIGMDKVRAKIMFRHAGLKTLDCLSISRHEWKTEAAAFMASAEKAYGYPMIVKPVCLGSSIGVSRCDKNSELSDAIELALELDDNALVEVALTRFKEINCSVIGPPEQVSVCEQPVASEEFLTFDAKYKRGRKSKSGGGTKGGMASLERLIPAPVSDELTSHIEQMAVTAFRSIGAAGLARVDFLINDETDEVLVNEINTMPGSIAFYLWEPAGLPFDELVDKLVKMAVERHRSRRQTRFSFDANLLVRA